MSATNIYELALEEIAGNSVYGWAQEIALQALADAKKEPAVKTYEEGVAEEEECTEQWRNLALQFDQHRMEALWHLKTLLANPEHAEAVRAFLSAPPLSGSEVLKQRLQELAKNQS